MDVITDLSSEELKETIRDYNALIVRSGTKVNKELIENAENLEIIGRAGIGVDNIDVNAATMKGIVVANAPQGNIISAAEHTMALLLSQCRNIPQAVNSLKSCKWERNKFKGVELIDKTLGIVGMGRIGTLVAHRAQSFGMKIIGFDPYVSRERLNQLGVEIAESFEDLLKRADFITVHLPKTDETIGMFGKKEFALMKDGVRLVNTARGGIFQEDALIEALKSGKVASIGLDVYPKEPCTESPLFDFEQAVVTPHLGASTKEAQDKAGLIVAEDVVNALKGQFVQNAVNIAVGSVEAVEALQPFLPLAEKLGKLYTHLAEGQLDSLQVEYSGHLAEYDTKILTIAILKGLFETVILEPVNYVNAPIIAEERGIKLSESKSYTSLDYINLIILKGISTKGEVKVGGTLLGKKNEPRFVNIYQYDIDIAPTKYMAFIKYIDKPGMIGKVGTLLGNNNINIALMQVGRKKIGGEAVMGLNVDSSIPKKVATEIEAQEGISAVWTIKL